MITNNGEPGGSAFRQRIIPWLNIGLTILMVGLGLWYLSTRVRLVDIIDALSGASYGYVLLAAAVMVITIALKAWRWQLMFLAEDPPIRYPPAFWGTALGQYVNLLVPFLRLGEIARIYGLNREAGINSARALGTLVVEKALDLIFFGLTIVAILPFVIIPDYVNLSGPFLVTLPVFLLIVLYLLAYQTDMVIRILRFMARPLPEKLEGWVLRVAVSGLQGLTSLRSPRLNLLLLATSLVIAFLSVYLPYILFPALGLPLSLLDAALIHVVVSIAIAPPSTPAKIGVFNAAAAVMLYQFGLENEAAIFSYTILFYLVVIVPQIVLGIFSASRSNWRWQSLSRLTAKEQ